MDHLQATVAHLKTRKRVLLLTTSNRWSGEEGGEMPKSTKLAHTIARLAGPHVTVMDITKLKIYPCEGNVSTERGNTCGEKKAALKDAEKNPSGKHRCWASINNADDELWKVSKDLLASDTVMFFGSVRWGQLNSFYQKLIERLTWLENRHSTLGEGNILSGIDAGVIVVGHNWRGAEIVETQKDVMTFFGFNVVDALCWNWQFTTPTDESQEGYRAASKAFTATFLEGTD